MLPACLPALAPALLPYLWLPACLAVPALQPYLGCTGLHPYFAGCLGLLPCTLLHHPMRALPVQNCAHPAGSLPLQLSMA